MTNSNLEIGNRYLSMQTLDLTSWKQRGMGAIHRYTTREVVLLQLRYLLLAKLFRSIALVFIYMDHSTQNHLLKDVIFCYFFYVV